MFTGKGSCLDLLEVGREGAGAQSRSWDPRVRVNEKESRTLLILFVRNDFAPTRSWHRRPQSPRIAVPHCRCARVQSSQQLPTCAHSLPFASWTYAQMLEAAIDADARTTRGSTGARTYANPGERAPAQGQEGWRGVEYVGARSKIHGQVSESKRSSGVARCI